MDDPNPNWGQTFELYVQLILIEYLNSNSVAPQTLSGITIKLLEKWLIGSSFLGQATAPIDSTLFETGKPIDSWYALGPKESASVSGEIHVQIAYGDFTPQAKDLNVKEEQIVSPTEASPISKLQPTHSGVREESSLSEELVSPITSNKLLFSLLIQQTLTNPNYPLVTVIFSHITLTKCRFTITWIKRRQ
jgi:hypothetical protein